MDMESTSDSEQPRRRRAPSHLSSQEAGEHHGPEAAMVPESTTPKEQPGSHFTRERQTPEAAMVPESTMP